MTTQNALLRAKQAQEGIPIYVVPDKRAAYGDEKVGVGNYQINGGKNVYSPFAPGTKTLAAKQFDLATQEFEETKRARALSEALAAQKTAASSATLSRTSSGGSSGSAAATKLTEKERANNALADAQAGIDAALASGTDPETLRKNLYSYEPDLTRQGINVNDVIAYLNNRIADSKGEPRSSGDPLADIANKNTFLDTAKQAEKQRLDERPWWQKLVDILPGEQYR